MRYLQLSVKTTSKSERDWFAAILKAARPLVVKKDGPRVRAAWVLNGKLAGFISSEQAIAKFLLPEVYRLFSHSDLDPRWTIRD